MEGLPYIDEHRIEIGANSEQVWEALRVVLRTDFGRTPAAVARLLGLAPAEADGDWRGVLEPGDSLRGFEIAQAERPARLVLRGHHRFSRYALVFELENTGATACTLRAETWAEFPGPTGRVYRALVIGSGGHRVVVRRLLRHVARSA
jgi:hypothetical protein